MKKQDVIILSFLFMLSACDDKMVLEPDASVTTPPVTIGQSHQGGTVFYVDGTGQHGLIAALSDQVGTTSVVFNSKGAFTAIPDQGTVSVPLIVSGLSGPVGLRISMASIYINHTYDGDLSISLMPPNGASIDLSSNNGGSGDNYVNTNFTPSGPSITGGLSPEDYDAAQKIQEAINKKNK